MCTQDTFICCAGTRRPGPHLPVGFVEVQRRAHHADHRVAVAASASSKTKACLVVRGVRAILQECETAGTAPAGKWR